jgi:hypothetical protein
MSKFTFICEDEPCPFGDSIIAKRTVEFNADTLDSVIGEFESFLRGCGFHLNGYLEMVEPNQKIVEDEDLDEYTESLFKDKRSVIRADEC